MYKNVTVQTPQLSNSELSNGEIITEKQRLTNKKKILLYPKILHIKLLTLRLWLFDSLLHALPSYT